MEDMVQQQFKYVLNDSMQNTTVRLAGIQLLEKEVPLSDDVCTVHTVFDGSHSGILLIRADRALLTRLAQKIMHIEHVTQQDIEDVAKEYFNVICGQVAGGLYHTARISSRFQIPQFYSGSYQPEGRVTSHCAVSYTSNASESIQVAYFSLLPPD